MQFVPFRMPGSPNIGENAGREGREDIVMPGKGNCGRYESIAGDSEQLRRLQDIHNPYGFRSGRSVCGRCLCRLKTKHTDDETDGERQIDGEHDDVQIKERVCPSETSEGTLGIGIVIKFVFHVSSFLLCHYQDCNDRRTGMHRKRTAEKSVKTEKAPTEFPVTESADSLIFSPEYPIFCTICFEMVCI